MNKTPLNLDHFFPFGRVFCEDWRRRDEWTKRNGWELLQEHVAREQQSRKQKSEKGSRP